MGFCVRLLLPRGFRPRATPLHPTSAMCSFAAAPPPAPLPQWTAITPVPAAAGAWPFSKAYAHFRSHYRSRCIPRPTQSTLLLRGPQIRRSEGGNPCSRASSISVTPWERTLKQAKDFSANTPKMQLVTNNHARGKSSRSNPHNFFDSCMYVLDGQNKK